MTSVRLRDAICAAAHSSAVDPSARVDVHRLDFGTPDFDCFDVDSLDFDCVPAFDEAPVDTRAGMGAQVPAVVHQLLGPSNVGALRKESA